MSISTLPPAQMEMLVAHIWGQHTAGKITWQHTITDTCFRSRLGSGATLFVTLFITHGKVYSMPCIVEVNKKEVNLDGNDPRLVRIGQQLADQMVLPKYDAEEFLREVGVMTDPKRRDNRINEVMGNPVQDTKTVLSGIREKITRWLS